MVRKRIQAAFKAEGFRAPRGRKEVWLPNWSITLMRSPWLPPNMASFKVPLNLNKLDLKDYLYHAYGIPVLRVRSWIKQPARLQRDGSNKWYRPKSIKRMIVEMDNSNRGGPFVWPEEITELDPWDKRQYDAAAKEQEQRQQLQMKYGETAPRAPGTLASLVSTLRNGQRTWRPTWAEQASEIGQHSGLGVPQELRRSDNL